MTDSKGADDGFQILRGMFVVRESDDNLEAEFFPEAFLFENQEM